MTHPFRLDLHCLALGFPSQFESLERELRQIRFLLDLLSSGLDQRENRIRTSAAVTASGSFPKMSLGNFNVIGRAGRGHPPAFALA